jgi:hypothetical protein
MSFGLSKLKKHVERRTERSYFRHLVVGEDAYALAMYEKLVQTHGPEEVGLLGRVVENSEDYRLKGPSSFRGQKNLDLLKMIYPELDLSLEKTPSLFMKEGTWREFGGRAKPEPLLFGEEYYTRPRILGAEGLSPNLSPEQLMKTSEKAHQVLLSEIEKVTPEDIVENVHWRVKGVDGVYYECEHMYWAHSPSYFLELYADKSQLSDELIELCESTQTPAQLKVSLYFEKPVSDLTSTLFMPQSYTHEWGHFIGEFKSSENESGQWAEFTSFIDKDASTEEEISKKFRLLKKNIEKIAPDMSSTNVHEYIVLAPEAPCLNIDDLRFLERENELLNCFFVSVNAPLGGWLAKEIKCEDSGMSPSHHARALASLTKTRKKEN